MNQYFLTMVLKSDLEEKTREDFLGEIKKKAASESGKIIKEDFWGVRDLAYPIKKQTKGFYAHFEFETEPSIIKGLDNSLKVEENVLRFLLTKI